MNIKQCTKCGEWKLDQIDFRFRWDRFCYETRCKKCLSSVDLQYYKDNKERMKARMRKNYKDNKEEYNRKAKIWRENNPERKKEIDRQYYKDNSEKIKHRAKQWRDDNIEYCRVRESEYSKTHRVSRTLIGRRYTLRKMNIPGSHTIEELKFIYKMQYGKCACCDKPFSFEELTVDHIKPVSKPNSSDYAWNIQLLCGSCNSSKCNHHSTDYREIKPVFFDEIIHRL